VSGNKQSPKHRRGARTHCDQLLAGIGVLIAVCVVAALALPLQQARAQQAGEEIDDITGEYHFLGPQDTLAILQEEGQLKGYVDVYQGEDESDAILEFPITIGSHSKNHVEFKTGKIHERYYRFAGTVAHGKGKKEDDADYAELVGQLEIVTVNGVTGTEHVERRDVVFKSKSKEETGGDGR
jgi:hypothetical protein